VGTAGILWYWFGTINCVSLIANLPIVPLADLIIVLGLGLAVTGLLCPPLAITFAACLKAVLAFLITLAHVFAQIPGGHMQFK
jgi:hypothetical protein